MAESDSDPPKDVHASRLKSLGTLIASVAALVTATGAYFKPQDHSVNKATYEELTKSIKELSDVSEKNHDDIVALRGYVEGQASKNSGPFPVTVQSDAGSPALGRSGDAGATVAFVQVPSSRPPPPVLAPPRPPPPQSFDTLVKQSKK
jgi:hypothetical protein